MPIVSLVFYFCQTPVLGLGLGVDLTFAGDNHNHKNDKNDNNPHLNFVKGTVLGDKEQGEGIRDRGQGIRDKGQGSSTLKTKSCKGYFTHE